MLVLVSYSVGARKSVSILRFTLMLQVMFYINFSKFVIKFNTEED